MRRGVLAVGGGLTHSSIIDSEFHGTIVGETTVGSFPAIEATIRGQGLDHRPASLLRRCR